MLEGVDFTVKIFSLKNKVPISALISILISIFVICLYIYLEFIKTSNLNSTGFISGCLKGIVSGLPALAIILIWVAYRLYKNEK